MKVYGLVGLSGTGKSYKASSLANKLGIHYIVDDGLLIKDSKVMAGTSAKKEPTMIAAVRRALFMDDDHAANVQRAIVLENPEGILLIGTSVNMIRRIAENLNLPTTLEIIQIEDIASSEEIKTARTIRVEEGKHVIPVPTLEIRKDFSGYFLHPLRILQLSEKGQKIESMEKTVMRPTYSYMGKFYIADLALESLIIYNANKVNGVYKVIKVNSVSHAGGIVANIEIAVYYGYKIYRIMEEIQKNVVRDVVELTAINVLQVNVYIKGIKVEPSREIL